LKKRIGVDMIGATHNAFEKIYVIRLKKRKIRRRGKYGLMLRDALYIELA
jgi:hypothetical protein